MSTLDLASQLKDAPIAPGHKRAPVAGQGFVRGWGVFVLPFDSGHVLGLRVFHESDAGPYRSVWHRDPAGAWTLHVQAEQLNTACPRYHGAGAKSVDHARIDVAWTGSNSFRVTVDKPALDWEVTATSTTVLQSLNAISARLPFWTYQSSALMKARELVARGLGMGDVHLTGTTPSGHHHVVMPERMYFIEQSVATLDGLDLGRPAHVTPNPRIGDVTFPARGILAVGEATWDPPPAANSQFNIELQ